MPESFADRLIQTPPSLPPGAPAPPPPGEEEIRHPDGRMEHPSVRFEKTDASFPWVLGLLLGAMAFAAVVHYVILLFFYEYAGYQNAVKKSPFPLAAESSKDLSRPPLPAQPRLEQVERVSDPEHPADAYAGLAAKEDALNRYGTTGDKNFVHVPIQKAIEQLSNKLPSRPAPAEAQPKDQHKENGLVDSGESNSGRMFRGKPKWYEH